MHYKWAVRRTKVDIVKMANALSIEKGTAMVLANRGIGTWEKAQEFLQPEQADFYPLTEGEYAMKGAEQGLALVERAIDTGELIAVYGDYDVDGVTSTAILYQTISYCGGNVMYYIPHRQKEGYGLNIEAIEELQEKGVSFLLTCDNGIAALEEIKLAKRLGMTVVVLDHHEPGFLTKEDGTKEDILPVADAILDPKQKDCSYPFPFLCAGGISYKFAVALLQRRQLQAPNLEENCLHLATLATVCDIVDLLEENRILVRKGLKTIANTKNLGLQTLLRETGIAEKKITEYHLGFVIGPCVNAAGRLETAKKAVALFCEKDPEQAKIYALELIAQNESRKEMTVRGTEQVIEQIEAKGWAQDKVIVAFQEEIHESIAGIVAGRVKEKYYHPTILITKSEDMAKGSGRSIEGYNMFEGLYRCKDLFAKFGGHPMAAGLSLPYENIEPLRQRLNQDCTLTEEQMIPVLRIEKQLSFGEIDMILARELEGIAPFGKGNPAPIFGSKKISVVQFSLIGKEKRILRLVLEEESSGTLRNGISFDGYERFLELIRELYGVENCDRILEGGVFDKPLDILYSIGINEFRGKCSVQLVLKDFRMSQ